MTFIPNTEADRQAMLAEIGVTSAHELFSVVPEEFRFPKLLLPPALSEMEVLREIERLSLENMAARDMPSFLGAGAYRHFIPSIVDSAVQRPEFATAYTPYQPEISQGTLQGHFEFQSMIALLTGMEAAVVSHYDGATAAAEAVIMAMGATRGKRRKAIVSPTLHPQFRAVIRTYTRGMGETIVGDDAPRGDLPALAGMIDEETACVIMQNPDFLGRIYAPAEMQSLADAAHEAGALFVVSANPISLGMLKPPGEYGADVVIGEGQPLGNPLNFGGPYLGIFATKLAHVRKVAGRIVGQTVDADGKTGYVLTLSSREQHIRREKASSNICSNQALNALAAAVYLSAMGRHGLRKVAELCYHKAHYAAQLVGEIRGFKVVPGAPFFHEFVVRCPIPVNEINNLLLREFGIIGGYDLGADYPDLADHMLICATEMNTRDDIENLANALRNIVKMLK